MLSFLVISCVLCEEMVFRVKNFVLIYPTVISGGD